MKIKSRDARLAEYNAAYPVHREDAEDRIRSYFAANGLNLEKACLKAAKKAEKIISTREYRSIHIVLREYPTETPRPRTFNGHTFSPNAKANKAYFTKALHSVIDTLELVSTPAEAYINAYVEMPSTVKPDEIILYESGLLRPATKPDADNTAKSYLDMLTGIVTVDDDLFYHLEVNKYYSLEPRVDIRIIFTECIESEYIYKKMKSRKTVKEAQEAGLVELKLMEFD